MYITDVLTDSVARLMLGVKVVQSVSVVTDGLYGLLAVVTGGGRAMELVAGSSGLVYPSVDDAPIELVSRSAEPRELMLGSVLM